MSYFLKYFFVSWQVASYLCKNLTILHILLNYTYMHMHIYIYIYICIYIYILSWKQCALPVITTLALWQLMYLGTCSHDVRLCIAGTNEPKSAKQAKQGADCFHANIYIMLILPLWDLSTLCCGSLMTTYNMLLA